MEKPYILHMLTPTRNVSPFDVNMACDAGYNVVVPYGEVGLEHVAGLVQDAIFSRGPKGVRRTGIFIGGREIGLAADMLDAARGAMVPPFEVSVFADPSGAFTTAAAMVAATERALRKTHNRDLKGATVLVLGGTGPVGTAASVLASGVGARVFIASHTSAARARVAAQVANSRYGADTSPADTSSASERASLFAEVDVVLACAKAGVTVMNEEEIGQARRLLAAADVNAVPPAGVAGVGLFDEGAPIAGSPSGAVGIGALAIGNIKYQTQSGLFKQMLSADKPLYLDFRDAFAFARELAA